LTSPAHHERSGAQPDRREVISINRRVLFVLSGAQFLMVLDQAVMNVSISQLVKDFDTSSPRSRPIPRSARR